MLSSLEGNHITTDLTELLLGSQCNHHLQKQACCLQHRDKLFTIAFSSSIILTYSKIEKKFLRVLFITFLPFVALVRVLGFSRSFDSLSWGSYPFQIAGSRAYCIPCCSTRTFGSWPQAGQREKKVAEICRMSLASAISSAHITQSRTCP